MTHKGWDHELGVTQTGSESRFCQLLTEARNSLNVNCLLSFSFSFFFVKWRSWYLLYQAVMTINMYTIFECLLYLSRDLMYVLGQNGDQNRSGSCPPGVQQEGTEKHIYRQTHMSLKLTLKCYKGKGKGVTKEGKGALERVATSVVW